MSTQVDFFTLKGMVEDLLENDRGSGCSCSSQPIGSLSWREPRRISRWKNDQSIGFIGEIDPKVVEFERVPFRVFAFELDLEALEDAFKTLAGLPSASAPAGRHAGPGCRGPGYGVRMRISSMPSVPRPGLGWSRSGWSTSTRARRYRRGTKAWHFTWYSGTLSAH